MKRWGLTKVLSNDCPLLWRRVSLAALTQADQLFPSSNDSRRAEAKKNTQGALRSPRRQVEAMVVWDRSQVGFGGLGSGARVWLAAGSAGMGSERVVVCAVDPDAECSDLPGGLGWLSRERGP